MSTANDIAASLVDAMRARLKPFPQLQQATAAPVPVSASVPEKRDSGEVQHFGTEYRVQHYKLPLLMATVKAGCEMIALVGPAASGKTSVCATLARMLKLPFEATSFGKMTSKSDLLGHISQVDGKYHDTAPVRRATEGGVFLADEFDAGNSNVGLYLNMMASNSFFATPAGMRNRHPKFTLIVGMNTYGRGKSRDFVGREPIDGAVLSRMVVIDWDYDDRVEAAMIGIDLPPTAFNLGRGGFMTREQWFFRVKYVREQVKLAGVTHIVSPRATLNGWRLMNQGVGKYWVEDMCVWQGLDADTRAKVEAQRVNV